MPILKFFPRKMPIFAKNGDFCKKRQFWQNADFHKIAGFCKKNLYFLQKRQFISIFREKRRFSRKTPIFAKNADFCKNADFHKKSQIFAKTPIYKYFS
jgi:hypothetical protein